MRESSVGFRIVVGIIIAVISFISFLGSQEFNPITGEDQYVSLTTDQEIALGLQSEPQLIQEFGGLSRDERGQEIVDTIGFDLVRNSVAADTPWEFEFHLLADRSTVNAFALPGGPIFITEALYSRLDRDELAGVLAHEIVHVLARHGAQRIAKSELTNGLIGAVGVASGEASAAQTAAMVGQIVNMSYGRQDELQSDRIGVCLMIDAGYDPQGMAEVMQVLAQASGGARQPEFFSTHPNPDNRIAEIEQAIANASENCPG